VSYSFDARHGLIILLAELFGTSGSIIVRLALDTGATRTTINVGLLTTIGYDPSLVPDRIQMTTGSGVEYAPLLLVRRVEALGQGRTDFRWWLIRCHQAQALTDFWGWIFSEGRYLTLTLEPVS
jgi:hypothetical protein